MVLVLLPVCAPTPSLLASVTAQVRVRLELAGLVLVKVTACSAAWYCATVAVPVSVNTPVPEL